MSKFVNRASRSTGIVPRIWLVALVLSIGLSAALPAAQPATGDPAAYVKHSVLANGLELFVNQNRAVPLATIMVSFRCGAITQAPTTAGLFHLYEHMMFAGNSAYRSQTEFMAALNRMGVANWNGGTSGEYVNYYITVPSDKLAEGLAFWAAAVRDPLFDPVTFEKEKQVVTNEIRGYHTDPSDIFANAAGKAAFPAYPWRKDISGSEANIANATLQMMRQIQSTWYIPNNAAVMVGGDVDAQAVRPLVEKHFGSWAKGATPPAVAPAHPGYARDVRLVYPDPTFYNGVGFTMITWRGPDVLVQTKDTYVSDVLLFLMSSPVGRFKQTIFRKVPGLYDAEHIGFGYPTQRDGGQYIFSTFFLYDPRQPADLLARQEALRAAVSDELKTVAADPAAYFGAAELELAKTKLADQNLMSMETAGSVLGNLNFWWTTATTDYFFSYEKNCRQVGFDDISRLISTWILDKPSVTALRVRQDRLAADPTLSEQQKNFGYETVSADTAYWWQSAAAK
jgi:zinc protease